MEKADPLLRKSLLCEASGGRPDGSSTPSVSEWLESPHLSRIVNHVALRHGIRSEDIPDIFQEVCISLFHKGMDSRVNATWVFKAIASRIVDFHRRSHVGRGEQRQVVAQDVPPVDGPDPELGLLVRYKASLLP